MRCDVEEGKILRGLPEALPTIKVVRTTFEVRARICHPQELSALTFRRKADGRPARKDSAHRSALLPPKFDSSKPKEAQETGARPGGRRRRSSIDDLYVISKVQAAIRAHAARSAARVARGAAPVVETFVEARLPVDQDGRLNANPARAAIVAVVDACRGRLGL